MGLHVPEALAYGVWLFKGSARPPKTIRAVRVKGSLRAAKHVSNDSPTPLHLKCGCFAPHMRRCYGCFAARIAADDAPALRLRNTSRSIY
jgi:hypothetical protein